MKLRRSTNKKITKDAYGENMPYLEVTEVLFVHCNTEELLSTRFKTPV